MTDFIPDPMRRFLRPVENPQDGTQEPTLDFAQSPIVLLAASANGYGRLATRMLQHRYGVNLMTWRLVALLASQPGVSVVQASLATGIDKGAVSRTLGQMEADWLAISEAGGTDPRRKCWQLSAAGYELHRKMLPASMEMHSALLDGFGEADVEALQGLLARLLHNINSATDAKGAEA
jgi:DNA-binding MarR family transcriptional regulator